MFAQSEKQTGRVWNDWEASVRSSRVKGVACIVDADIASDFLRERDYARKLLQRWVIAEG